MSFVCSIASKTKGYLIQTQGDKELHEWLYAINPLLAGQIRCGFKFLKLYPQINAVLFRSATARSRPKVVQKPASTGSKEEQEQVGEGGFLYFNSFFLSSFFFILGKVRYVLL